MQSSIDTSNLSSFSDSELESAISNAVHCGMARDIVAQVAKRAKLESLPSLPASALTLWSLQGFGKSYLRLLLRLILLLAMACIITWGIQTEDPIYLGGAAFVWAVSFIHCIPYRAKWKRQHVAYHIGNLRKIWITRYARCKFNGDIKLYTITPSGKFEMPQPSIDPDSVICALWTYHTHMRMMIGEGESVQLEIPDMPSLKGRYGYKGLEKALRQCVCDAYEKYKEPLEKLRDEAAARQLARWNAPPEKLRLRRVEPQ